MASLVKQLDASIEKNSEKKMTGFLVLLSDDPAADEAKVKEFAEKHGVKNLPLTIFEGAGGPPSFNLAKDAEVTVLMWKEQNVKANQAFAKGQLTPKAIKTVLEETSKILD